MAEDIDERLLLARERTALANERTRLSNERTFLAWTRTGLACVAGGLAIIRFVTFQNYNHQVMSQLIGCVLVVLGIAIFNLSYFDYRDSTNKLKVENGYAGSLWTISAISLVLITVSILMLLVVFRFAEITLLT